MAQRRTYLFIEAATAVSAGAGIVIKTDYRFDDGGLQRTLFGSLTSGAEINLFLYATHTQDGQTSSVEIRHLETTISAGSSSFNAATNTFSEVITGPITAVEVVKAGASGTATVIGIL